MRDFKVDSDGLAAGGLQVRIVTAQVLVGELLYRLGPFLPLDVVCGVAARADAPEHVAGAAAGLRQLHLAVPGDDNAPSPTLDTRLMWLLVSRVRGQRRAYRSRNSSVQVVIGCAGVLGACGFTAPGSSRG